MSRHICVCVFVCANAKRPKRFAIVAVIVPIAVKINKKDLPTLTLSKPGGWYLICLMLFYRVTSHRVRESLVNKRFYVKGLYWNKFDV